MAPGSRPGSLRRRLDEAIQRQGIAAGAAVVGVDQDGELVERRRLLLVAGAHQCLGVVQHQRFLARAQRQRRQALLLAHRPAVARLRVSSCSGSWLRP